MLNIERLATGIASAFIPTNLPEGFTLSEEQLAGIREIGLKISTAIVNELKEYAEIKHELGSVSGNVTPITLGTQVELVDGNISIGKIV